MSRSLRARARKSLVAIILGLAALHAAASAFAEPRASAPRADTRRRPADAGAARAAAGAGDDAGAAGAAETPSRRGEGAENRGDAGKGFRFGELEIEGRLKSPQIVYFLRRVRAELAAGDLGHRSFVPELEETRGEPSF